MKANGYMISDITGIQRDTILDIGVKGARFVLDVGCGNGEKTFYVSRHAERVVGIDPDRNMVKAARTNFIRKNLVFELGQAESMAFPPATFCSVLFNESLHHIPVAKQFDALRNAYRVLKPKGRLLITEPIYGSGSFEEILRFYNDERETRRSALKSIEESVGIGFRIASQKKIRIAYACNGFDDLYRNNIKTKPYAHWNPNDEQDIVDILGQCDRTPEGYSIIDYHAMVWLLVKG